MPRGIFPRRPMSEETKKKIGLANSIVLKGRKLSKEHCKNIGIASSKFLTGRKLSEETKRKISETKKSQQLHHSITHKKKLSIISKRLWNNLDYASRCTNIKQKSPNKAEEKLLELLNVLFPKEYEFVGDNKIRIESFNPDYININGQKKLIELFGERWHLKPGRVEQDKRRIKIYNKYGYKTFIVWSQELYRNTENLKKMLVNFHNNGGVSSV